MASVDKHDQGKPPMSFLGALYLPLQEVACVLAFGNKKYENIFNYQTVLDGETRFLDAMVRHVMARCNGEVLDSESGLPHLAHAVCCGLMSMWHRTCAPYQAPKVPSVVSITAKEDIDFGDLVTTDGRVARSNVETIPDGDEDTPIPGC